MISNGSCRRLAPIFSLALVMACSRSGLRVGGEGGGIARSGPIGGSGGEGGSGGAFGVVELALGAGHSCLRTLDGKVYCWGDNLHGQIGAPMETSSLSPHRVKLPGRARTIAAGTYHSCAALENDEVYCWGRNDNSEVSVSDHDEKSPVRVDVPAGTVKQLSLGEGHSCVLEEQPSVSGAVYCWGRNSSGQVGIGSTDTPVVVPTEVASNHLEIALGGFHSSGLVRVFKADGSSDIELSGWGNNVQLQLGFGGGDALVPTPVALLGLSNIRSGLGEHTCAVFDGQGGLPGAFCWGSNSSGQLGRGSTTEKELPGPAVGLPMPIRSIAPGFVHTCALAADRVYCWGSNGSGQLGNGGGADLSAPHEVNGLDGVTAIGSGTLHSCAFLSETDIRCWGGNDFGQLGDGTTTTRLTPVPIHLPG
jgi:alpha-tubulin suppressor-like RCC1 family protein